MIKIVHRRAVLKVQPSSSKTMNPRLKIIEKELEGEEKGA